MLLRFASLGPPAMTAPYGTYSADLDALGAFLGHKHRRVGRLLCAFYTYETR